MKNNRMHKSRQNADSSVKKLQEKMIDEEISDSLRQIREGLVFSVDRNFVEDLISKIDISSEKRQF